MSNKDKFEQYIKEAAHQHDEQTRVPDSDWDDLQQRMQRSGGGSPKTKLGATWKKLITAGVAAAAVAGAALYFITEDNAQEPAYAERTKEIKEDQNAARPAHRNSGTEKSTPASETGIEDVENRNEDYSENARVSEHGQNETDAPEGNNVPDSGSDREDHNARAHNENKAENNNDHPAADNEEAQDAGEPGGSDARDDSDKPDVTFNLTESAVCTGERFAVTGGNRATDIQIITDEGIFENGECSFEHPGNKDLHVQFTVNGEQYEEYLGQIRVHDQPRADFETHLTPVDGGRPQYKLESRAVGSASYKWMVNGDKIGEGEEISTFFLKKDDYEIRHITTSEYGCTDTAEQTVTVRNDYNLLAPDAFTPNGDGINDTWFPVALKEPVYEFELKVFDMEKNVVFQTSDPGNEWNGPENNPETRDARNSNYFWKAVVWYKGQKEQYKGTVRILP